jgi:hypothetical protein
VLIAMGIALPSNHWACETGVESLPNAIVTQPHHDKMGPGGQSEWRYTLHYHTFGYYWMMGYPVFL